MNRKLGYYTIGDLEFESKVRACMVATKLLNKLPDGTHPMSVIDWHFNDDVFGKHDWKKEPEQSLDFYYNERARQLRNQYDRIIVSYSGGADSHNMLSAFVRQNLHVDEIITTTLDEATKGYSDNVTDQNKSSNHAYVSEYKFQTADRLADFKKRLPNTRFRVFDMSHQMMKRFRDSSDGSWIMNVREEINPVDASRYDFLRIPEFRNSLDAGKKTAIISGVDKPRIIIDYPSREVFIRFTDRLTNITPIGNYMKEYTNVTIEYFYWAPESTNLLSKQAHVVKNWLQNNPMMQRFFFVDAPPEYGFDISMARAVNERILRPVLYSTWNPMWFQADKGVLDWYSEFDGFFFTKFKGSAEHNIWKEGIRQIMTNAAPYINNDKGFADGFMTFYKQYPIGQCVPWVH